MLLESRDTCDQSNGHHFPAFNIPPAIFAGDESPDKHLSIGPGPKKHVFVYFFKSASKLAQIGTLRALGGQDSGTQWTRENPVFSPVVHRGIHGHQVLGNQCLWPFFVGSNFS
jgi:hypothetical protein